MKTSASTPASTRSPRRRADAVAKKPSPYVSSAQTQALMDGSLQYRRTRLEAGDMVNTEDAAALLGVSRVTVNSWIAAGRLVGLTQTRRGFRLPAWQLEPLYLDLIPKLTRALGTQEGWALLAFLETPLGGLEGRTPKQAIDDGNANRVLELAGAEDI